MALIATALTLFGLSASAGLTKHDTTWQGKKRQYVVFTPDGESKGLPLILLLHGSVRNGKTMIDQWQKAAATNRVVLAAPDSLDSKLWQGPHDGPAFLRKVVEEVVAATGADNRRIYLFGHSAGGHFALLVGLMQSEYFAAVAVHAGMIPRHSESFVDVARRKIPVAIWSGDRDPVVVPDEVKRTADLLQSKNFPAALEMMRRHDHNYYDVARTLNGEVWKFLSQHSLTKDPVYVDYGDRE